MGSRRSNANSKQTAWRSAGRSTMSSAPTCCGQTLLDSLGDNRAQRQTAAPGIRTQLREHVARNFERRRHRRLPNRYRTPEPTRALQITIRLPERDVAFPRQYRHRFGHAASPRQQAMRRVQVRRYAGELVALAPDVIVAHGLVAAGWLVRATRTVPIVFVNVADPVGNGLVESLARPGVNATGFMTIELSMSVKWLELLKQIAPGVTRVAVLRDPTQGSGTGPAYLPPSRPWLHCSRWRSIRLM